MLHNTKNHNQYPIRSNFSFETAQEDKKEAEQHNAFHLSFNFKWVRKFWNVVQIGYFLKHRIQYKNIDSHLGQHSS